MKEKCPACGDYQGVSDYDEDIGTFYTCEACDHQWNYQQGCADCNSAARAGKFSCDACGREWS